LCCRSNDPAPVSVCYARSSAPRIGEQTR
jgi:hypothetical protein